MLDVAMVSYYVLIMNTTSNIARYRAVPRSSRKAAIRNSPNWLDALDLDGPVAAAPAPTPGIAKNAAEQWAKSLPDLAIWARRRELDARTYAAPADGPVLAPPAPAAPVAKLAPARRRPVSALRDAARNAALLMLVTVVLMACARAAHLM